MSKDSQKEYLKKYLSIGKDLSNKKKRKKKANLNTIPSRLTVIDDNADTFQQAVREDLMEDEDAPQIVAVIDERPPSLQVDEKSKTNLWIPIGTAENSTESVADSNKTVNNEDLSPPRFRVRLAMKKSEKADVSPPRKKKTPSKVYDESEDMVMKVKIERDISPPRKKKHPSPPRSVVKTLDGKTAGLQNAKQLAAETSVLKEKEMEMFNNMSSEISGANATTIIRDKKTGRVRNLDEEKANQLEKMKKEEVNKMKYSRWGRGLKQVEDATKKREEELNEMNKPLARYANDEDLERYLKEQEREGDPMLAYIRKKKRKKDVEEGKPMKPEYMGQFMPNRFAIKPGHRWDGVDRSNGYEKKWFDIQNTKLAQQEEAYKWSTEDM